MEVSTRSPQSPRGGSPSPSCDVVVEEGLSSLRQDRIILWGFKLERVLFVVFRPRVNACLSAFDFRRSSSRTVCVHIHRTKILLGKSLFGGLPALLFYSFLKPPSASSISHSRMFRSVASTSLRVRTLLRAFSALPPHKVLDMPALSPTMTAGMSTFRATT